MCYCLYDNDGECTKYGFVEGKTKESECRYTYNDPDDIGCASREVGWYEEEDDYEEDEDWDDDDDLY